MIRQLFICAALIATDAHAVVFPTGRGGLIIMSSPSARSGNARMPFTWNMQCVEMDDNGTKYLNCNLYTPDNMGNNFYSDAPRPIYHCSFTAYAQVQRGHCTDGQGAFPSKLRNSGPHPRNK